MLTWELVGAVVGAGLASGREIASFFSRYGNWSWLGIILGVLAMVGLSDVLMPRTWENKWFVSVWRLLLKLLLLATGGAMLAGAGEISKLILPSRMAHWFAMAGTLLLAWCLAHRVADGLAWVSRLLLVSLVLMITLGLTVPPMRAVKLEAHAVPQALIRGVTYGGFNAALQVPIMARASLGSHRRKRHACLFAGMLILVVLFLGNAVLLRHPALLGEAMPFVRMLAHFGKFGYYLGLLCLYLAVLSTLTACMRGLGHRPICTGGIILSACLGFTGVVEVLYPLLGGGCFLMLAAAKFTNSMQDPFNSGRDML